MRALAGHGVHRLEGIADARDVPGDGARLWFSGRRRYTDVRCTWAALRDGNGAREGVIWSAGGNGAHAGRRVVSGCWEVERVGAARLVLKAWICVGLFARAGSWRIGTLRSRVYGVGYQAESGSGRSLDGAWPSAGFREALCEDSGVPAPASAVIGVMTVSGCSDIPPRGLPAEA